MKINPTIQTDFYKVNHVTMYPEGTTKIYSNFTPRKSRIDGISSVVFFGFQYFLLEYLIKQWKDNFFGHFRQLWTEEIRCNHKKKKLSEYKLMIDCTLGADTIQLDHIEKLYDLGYLPLEIKAVPEGTLVPIGVPCLTITNTVDHAYWLVNYLETIISCTLWQPITSATLAHQFRKLLNSYALETTGTTEGVQWQGHDFSMRGMSSLESACTSGAGHLLSFTGTDTIPAISFLESYYMADVTQELVGASVPATEHSVMSMNIAGQGGELATFNRLLNLYPSGILSVVSDTFDLWKVCTEYLPALKDKILSRNGKLVIRPDSGDPVKILTGYLLTEIKTHGKPGLQIPIKDENGNYITKEGKSITQNEFLGVVELLWKTFGGNINERGYRVLDSHIGAIYGDSINLQRADEIGKRLMWKKFASTNIVLGIGSYTYQMNTRDTFGFAMKATYGEVLEVVDYKYNGDGNSENNGSPVYASVGREIYKDPVTDDGTKKSKKGLLRVVNHGGKLEVIDQQTYAGEKASELQTVFLDGKLIRSQSLSEIRERLNNQ